MKITFVAIGCEQLAISLLAGICKRNGHEVQVAYSAGLFMIVITLKFHGWETFLMTNKL
jgi:hypothetical protein